MEMQERSLGAVTILDLSGRLTMGEASIRLKDKIHSLVQQDRRQIVVNLGGVSFIDSAGLGQLIAAYTTVTREGGGLKLLHPTARAQDLLAVTKLLTVFDTFDSEDEAVRSFGTAH